MILGFDASTKTVGYSFYNGTEVVDAGFIDISKQETNKDKAFHVISILDANPNIRLVSKINLEAALSGFMGGRTSQQTVILLARFNAVFEYIITEHWKIPITLLGAMTARKTVFGKSRIQGVDPKEYVKNQLSSRMDLTKFDKKNKIGNIDVRMADVYDAIVMSMA